MKVHRVVLMIVDHDDLGSESTRQEIECARYPNDCLSPKVVSVETEEVKWSDDHPLNNRGWREAFDELFGYPGDAR